MDIRNAQDYAAGFERRINEFVRSGVKKMLAQGAPTLSQYFLMGVLQDGTPRRITELAQALDVSSPAITGLVKELAKSGYIRRIEDPGDRRVTLVGLTPKGREALTRAQEKRRRKAVEILRHFEEGEIDAFFRTLDKIHGLLNGLD